MSEPYIIRAGDFDSETMERQWIGHDNTVEWVDKTFSLGDHGGLLLIVRDKPKPVETLYCPIYVSEVNGDEGDVIWATAKRVNTYGAPVAGYYTKKGDTYGVATNEDVEALRAQS